MDPNALYSHAKIRIILRVELFWRKGKKAKNTFFGHLIPYNPELRIFLENSSDSNDEAYCSLRSCKKVGKSLEPSYSKG